jgi:hypothetical protein
MSGTALELAAAVLVPAGTDGFVWSVPVFADG